MGKKPGLIVGLTLFSFLSTVDEFSVSIFAMVEGYSNISIGTLLGSAVITLALFLLVFVIYRSRIPKSSRMLAIVPIYIGLLLTIDLDDIYYLRVVLTFGVLIISVYLFYKLAKTVTNINEETDNDDDSYINKDNSFYFLLFGSLTLIFLSYFLANATADITPYLHIGYLSAGFLIPGVLGSLPELMMVKSSLKNEDKESASGIVIGSTLMKATIFLPIIVLLYNYVPTFSNYLFSGSLVSLIIIIIIIFI
jgi:cation:H+ antiporter